MNKWENRIIGEGIEAPDQLLANPMNFRRHPKEQLDALEGILETVGWVQRVIVNQRTGHLIDGHARIELALKRSEPGVPVLYVDLTDNEERTVLAALDPISQLANHDQEVLDRLLEDIGDPGHDELAAFLESLHSMPEEDDEPEEGLVDPDDVPEPLSKYRSKPGDIWILGDHRVMCGDSTSLDAVGELCAEEQVDLVWTDPPYNVDYEGTDGQKIQNDSMGDTQFRTFLYDVFTAAIAWTKEGGPIYIAHADSEGFNFRGAMLDSGWLFKQCLIWVKNSMVLGRQDYQWQHEPILYGWKPGAAHKWYGEFNKKTTIDQMPDIKEMDKPALINHIRHLRNAMNTSVQRFDKPKKNGDHPTMKPVELVAHMIKNSSRKGDSVLDTFGGSGSTMIACEQYGRKARLMELDPRYADVIVRRWQEFTGRSAILEATGQAFDEVTPAEQPAEIANA